MEKNEEDEIFDAFDYANSHKFGTLTGQKIISAVKSNNLAEVKRLISLPVNEGGIILLRLIQKDETGKTALEIAQELKHVEVISILLGH